LGDGRRGRLISASDRRMAVELISESVDSGASLYKACEELGISKRTYNRWKETDSDYIDKRTTCAHPEPANKLTKEEKETILEIVNSEEFASKAPSEIVPILADRGKYIASESSFYKVLREAEELNHRGRSKAPVSKPISTHKAIEAKQVWMWDITYLNGPIKGKYYYLYLISDLFSRKIVGWEVWEAETAEHASELIKKACREEKIIAKEQPLVLHSDNGSPMKGATMLETLYNLGVIPSRSRPRVSNDNPYAESLFKTLKYRPNYQPKGFNNITEARLWVMQFVKWYNYEHKHSGIGYVSPIERHEGLDIEILKHRHEVYEQAKAAHPERWTRETRNWNYKKEEWLNPERTVKEKQAEMQEAQAC
jgi:putative transposase